MSIYIYICVSRQRMWSLIQNMFLFFWTGHSQGTACQRIRQFCHFAVAMLGTRNNSTTCILQENALLCVVCWSVHDHSLWCWTFLVRCWSAKCTNCGKCIFESLFVLAQWPAACVANPPKVSLTVACRQWPSIAGSQTQYVPGLDLVRWGLD